ncbi:hypothetical protein ACIGW4_37845 [Streptomyces sp. NPDC053513]|uniref:hypothetical protein n=1 Tax=unclassified Streptomyces TaxID=2593676 RepID=UPI0037CEF9FC
MHEAGALCIQTGKNIPDLGHTKFDDAAYGRPRRRCARSGEMHRIILTDAEILVLGDVFAHESRTHR